MAIFFVEKTRALHLTSFLLSVHLKTIATSQSGCGNLDSYGKILFCKTRAHIATVHYIPSIFRHKLVTYYKMDSFCTNRVLEGEIFTELVGKHQSETLFCFKFKIADLLISLKIN